MSFPTGATVVGIKCTDGVVVATDTMISWGTIVLSEKGVKAFKLTDTIVLASGDGDYTAVVKDVIRRHGVSVEVFGVPGLTAASLINSANSALVP